MTTEQGGAIANRQGNILEQQVRQAFASHGFREVSFAEYEKIASGSTLPGVPVPDLLVRRGGGPVPYLRSWCGGCLTSPFTGTGG